MVGVGRWWSYRLMTRIHGSHDQHRRRFRRRATMRACAGPSDASGALSRVEGEMTAFQISSALIWADWGFHHHEMDAEDGRTSLQMDLGDPGSYILCTSTFKGNTEKPVAVNQLQQVRGWWKRAASRSPADAGRRWQLMVSVGSCRVHKHRAHGNES